MRLLAEQIEGSGRSAWALRQVEEREAQVSALLRDFGKGLYAGTSAFDWLAMLTKFREAVLTDVNTALQAPKTPARIRLSRPSVPKNGLEKEELSPQDVAPELGVDARTVRRRIQAGQLGPWRKDGRRWVISREAFLRYWDQLASDSDLPRPR